MVTMTYKRCARRDYDKARRDYDKARRDYDKARRDYDTYPHAQTELSTSPQAGFRLASGWH